jgi:hypothetical protein
VKKANKQTIACCGAFFRPSAGTAFYTDSQEDAEPFVEVGPSVLYKQTIHKFLNQGPYQFRYQGGGK